MEVVLLAWTWFQVKPCNQVVNQFERSSETCMIQEVYIDIVKIYERKVSSPSSLLYMDLYFVTLRGFVCQFQKQLFSCSRHNLWFPSKDFKHHNLLSVLVVHMIEG